MEERKLHIVCHDVPFPPDYGGVFDLYYKIITLHEEGSKSFTLFYQRSRGTTHIEKLLRTGLLSANNGNKGFSHQLPYIVCSRSNPNYWKDFTG
jgi:hypothetical protein